jgi:hypothetical protein
VLDLSFVTDLNLKLITLNLDSRGIINAMLSSSEAAFRARPTLQIGRAIDQEVSRRLPTAAAWVQARVKSYGICGGQSCTGAGFPRVQ